MVILCAQKSYLTANWPPHIESFVSQFDEAGKEDPQPTLKGSFMIGESPLSSRGAFCPRKNKILGSTATKDNVKKKEIKGSFLTVSPWSWSSRTQAGSWTYWPRASHSWASWTHETSRAHCHGASRASGPRAPCTGAWWKLARGTR